MRNPSMQYIILLILAVSVLAACGEGVNGKLSTVPAAVAKTGQTVSYDNNVMPADDGALQNGVAWPSPRFVDNGDGTITDKLTDLVWLKDANCIATHDAASPGNEFDKDGTTGDGLVTWQHALDFMAGINNGTYADCNAGKTDWRLPDYNELLSLMDYGQSPSLPSNNLLANIPAPAMYWSSTSSDGISAMSVDFSSDGTATSKDIVGDVNYVLAVRGTSKSSAPAPVARTGQTTSYDANTVQADDGALQKGVTWPSPRFEDNGDGTVRDKLTGLVWLKDANCIATHDAASPGNEFDKDGTTGDGLVTWQHALDFVAGIDNGLYADCSAGRSNWRLPNIRELMSLHNMEEANLAPWLNTIGFANVLGNDYWSSTSAPSSPATNALQVSFAFNGEPGSSSKSNLYAVLPVTGT